MMDPYEFNPNRYEIRGPGVTWRGSAMPRRLTELLNIAYHEGKLAATAVLLRRAQMGQKDDKA